MAVAVPAVASAGLTASITTGSPKDVSATGATLRATVLLSVLGGNVGFEYGTTTAYGAISPSATTVLLGIAQNVAVPVAGLQPATTYHVRGVAVSALLPAYGADVTFTTSAAPSSGSGSSGSGSSGSGSGSSGSGSSGSGSGSSGSNSGSSGSGSNSGSSGSGSSNSGSGSNSGSSGSSNSGSSSSSNSGHGSSGHGSSGASTSTPSNDDTGDDDSASDDASPAPAAPATPTVTAAPVPALGRTIGVEAVKGTVTVTSPSGASIDLSSAKALPTGTVIDARHGTAELTTALDRRGATQTGRFWGGVFQVRQSATDNGLTQLLLRGGDFGACPAATTARLRAHAAKSTKKQPARSLWGSDDHGRFQTRGRGSVATVRGTRWYTEDRCDGTLTRVVKGAVSVYDAQRQRATVVTHGHEYLARLVR